MARQRIKLSDVDFKPFKKNYMNDVTAFNRLEFFSSIAILRETVFSPLSSAICLTLTLLFWSTSLASAPIAVVLSICLTCFISVSFIKSYIQFQVGYNGAVYPQSVVDSVRGLYIIALDTTQQPAQIIGTVAVEPNSEFDGGWLTRYCVSHNYRGIGLGKRLLSMALEHCSKVGFRTVKVGCWDISSEFPIYKIFERAGFEVFQITYVPWFFPLYKMWFMEKHF